MNHPCYARLGRFCPDFLRGESMGASLKARPGGFGLGDGPLGVAAPRCDSEAAQQGGQQGLLGVQAVFRLVEDPAGAAFDHAGADFLASVGR